MHGVLLLLLLAPAQTDPAGDMPPSFETASPFEQVPVPPSSPRAGVIVLPAVGLGVAPDVVSAVSSAVRDAVAARADVMTVALSAEDASTLASCADSGCAATLDRLGAAGVVTTSVMPLSTSLAVTVRLKSRTGVTKQHETGSADSLSSFCQRSVAALPFAALPTTTPMTTTSSRTASIPRTPSTPSTPSTSSTPAAPTEKTAPPSGFSIDKGAEQYPPITMVLISYGLGFLPIVGVPFILPLAQGVVVNTYGPELVGVAYPNWVMGTVAGYATYAVGFVGGGALYVGGIFALTGGASPLVGSVLVLSGAGLALGSVLLEPLVFSAVSSVGATWASTPE
jgi:hypothetical protein